MRCAQESNTAADARADAEPDTATDGRSDGDADVHADGTPACITRDPRVKLARYQRDPLVAGAFQPTF